MSISSNNLQRSDLQYRRSPEYYETDYKFKKPKLMRNTYSQTDEKHEEIMRQMEETVEIGYKVSNDKILEDSYVQYNVQNEHQIADQGQEFKIFSKELITLVKNEESIECYTCPLCNNELPWYGEGVTITLDRCNHLFCRYCIEDLLKNIINYKKVELQCPYPECYIVDPILYKKYLMVCVERSSNNTTSRIFHCKTFQCEGWCVIEGSNVYEFLCPICKKYNNVHSNNVQTEHKITDPVQIDSYQELVALTENNIVPNFEPFECPICFISYKPFEGLVLKNCLHTFCKECLSNTVKYSTDVDIKCPYSDKNYSCDATIGQCEIKEVLNPIDFNKYLEKSIIHAEAKAGKSAFHCKTPNCPGWCIYESDVDNFTCPVCKKTNCLRCKMIHKKSCAEDQFDSSLSNIEKSDILINQMLDKKDAMLCPQCQAVVMKISGCDSITCTICKTQLCWRTRGLRWGPKGIGDTSGGCQCSAYKKCDPLCQGCH
ncbi:PREDICTED: ranBP-type and C3HC4-type zinc finger-containing protein 1-like [Polistes dominula]|uniref:RanBP-type and C3HC4-type zinc finger-containing protein 1-like n=1 Tax=Polistes dominula TaxID=743375 RepID=A0ABM1I9W8_POLDO|nr:PREDICTED: ranBP-type and C3HC4-type zinc finger-containing protein 1-like [Polistes dominula]